MTTADPAGLLERTVAFGALLLAGNAGLFLRFVAASGIFVAASVAFRRLPSAQRTWAQVGASLVLIGVLTTPLIAAIMAGYAALVYWLVERAPLGSARLAVLVPVLGLQAIAPIFWLPHLPGYGGSARQFVAFATNVTLLRSWSYVYDRSRGRLRDAPSLRDYALFTFFFPAFPNGPLVSLDDFRRGCLPAYGGPASPQAFPWRALGRVATGLVALALVLPLDGTLGATAYAAAARGGAASAWRQAVLVYLGVYLGFTAWTEVAIGLARCAGIALPENFDAPHKAYGVADFWRRWNITLGIWLRRYVYQPLGGSYPRRGGGPRRPEWANTAAVFGVMAAYHIVGGLKLLGPGLFPVSAIVPWVLWAALNTVAVLATRRLVPAGGIRLLAVPALTLAFCCVGHLTAFFPPGMPLRDLPALYRQLLPG